MGRLAFAVIVSVASAALADVAQAGATLDAIKARQHLICGVDTALRGFSVSDAAGEWSGFDVDVCRAVAAAVLGDPGKVRFEPTRTIVRFDFLRSGKIDVLSRNTTWTMSRETELGLSFVATVFYDGQGFLVARKYGARSARELDGATVCVQPGTTTELNIKEYFAANNMTFKPVIYETSDEVSATFFSGRCQVLTTDASKLAIFRQAFSPKGRQDDYVILPEIVSKEPLAPAVRKGDGEWRDVVKWTIFALIEAEEYGVTQSNVETMAKQPGNAQASRLLSATPAVSKALGLPDDWVVKVIKAVGNYEELWNRNFGPLGLQRGLNRLWSKGGLLYAPPLR
jgi:general L-amino acid transport system substrate-binding protein